MIIPPSINQFCIVKLIVNRAANFLYQIFLQSSYKIVRTFMYTDKAFLLD